MDENKQKPRADYQPSVEAGLRRLESEKLSFLGSNNLVSKFDPKDLEAYAHIDDEDEEEVGDSTSTYDRTLPEISERLSDAMTLDRMKNAKGLDSEAMTLDRLEASDDLEFSEDAQEPGESTAHHEPYDRLKGVTDSVASLLDDDDEEQTMLGIREDLSELADLPAYKSASKPEVWASQPATTLEFAALRSYDSKDETPSVDFSQTAKSIEPSDSSDFVEVQDLSSQQFMMLSPSMELDTNAEDVNGLGQSSSCVASNVDLAIDQMAKVQSEAERMERAATQDLGREANEVFLETAETVDVGSVAERVRAALEAQEAQKPSSRVIRQGSVKLQRPQPAEPVSALEKLKQQGLFEHLGAHAEVSNNILDIQGLNALLPQSELTSYPGIIGDDDDEDAEDQTCEQEPEGVEEVRQMVMRAKASSAKPVQAPKVVEIDNLTIPLQQPEIIPTEHAGENDLDDRMTIPISVKDHPEFAKILNAKPEPQNNAPKARHRSPAQTTLHAPTLMMLPEKESRFGTILIWVVVVVILLGGAFAVLFITGLIDKLPFLNGSSAVIEAELETQDDPPTLPEIKAAIASTAIYVHEATQFDVWMEPWLETRINHQSSPESRLTYLELAMTMFSQNPLHRQRLTEDYIASGQYTEARKIIREAPEDVQNQPLIKDLFYQSFAKDPKFIGPPVTLDESICDMVSPLGGGSTLTFKMLKDDKPVGAFKPLQTRRQSNYRAEIAAWRLCELLNCSFDIPWNRPIRIEYDLFHRLYNRAPEKKRNEYRHNLTDIIWTKEENSRFVYGTHKDWVPDFTRFPIELTSMWRPWLSLENYIETFKPLDDALSSLKRRPNTQLLYSELLKQSPGLTTKQLATQVSEVLVFDFLVGNWDRFSGVPQWWGVNCQFKDSRITSIDNGAAFPTYSNDKVYERFMMTERFNPKFIQALRNLDKTKTFELLFPNASEHETKSFEQFWKQREAVLKRVEDLSIKHGADKVLSL